MLIGAAFLCSAASAAAADPCTDTPPYNASAAWAEFEEQLRLDYSYLARAGPQFESALSRARTRALATTTQQQLADLLQQFTKIFADPHFNVGPDCASDYAYVPSASDLWAEFRGDEAFIVDVKRASAADRQGIRPGWRIVSINGASAPDAAKAPLGDYLDTLTSEQRNFGLNVELTGRLRQPRTIVLHDGSAERRFQLPPGYESVARPADQPKVSVERIGDVAVIRFNNSLGDQDTIAQFKAALTASSDAKGMILDLRDTPGGGTSSVARGILGHFVAKEAPYQVHVYTFEERRFGVVRKAVEYVLPRAPLVTMKTIALGGRWTGSMGEGLMLGLEANGVRTVGAPLADQLGGGFNRKLNGLDVSFWLANEALYHVDGRAREDFLPQVHIASAERGANGEDLGLNAALAELADRQAQPERVPGRN